jgi:acetoacetate decarboxylase
MPERKPPIGYTFPLSPDGRASIVPPPPWHYSGDFLIVEYHTDPDAVIALLPPELEPADDPGAVAAIFADWQSCSDDLHELTDPIQAQYKEFFLVVGAKYQGQPVSRCVYIGWTKIFRCIAGTSRAFPKSWAAFTSRGPWRSARPPPGLHRVGNSARPARRVRGKSRGRP